MARREQWPGPAEDDDAYSIVGLCGHERVVEFDEQTTVLRIAGARPVERDAGDRALVEQLVLDESVLGHFR